MYMKLDIATKLQLNAVVEVVTTADWLAQLVKKFKKQRSGIEDSEIIESQVKKTGQHGWSRNLKQRSVIEDSEIIESQSKKIFV